MNANVEPNRSPDLLALGDAEMAFASDLLVWLCHRRIIGSITLRQALLELRSYDAGDSSIRPPGDQSPSAGR